MCEYLTHITVITYNFTAQEKYVFYGVAYFIFVRLGRSTSVPPEWELPMRKKSYRAMKNPIEGWKIPLRCEKCNWGLKHLIDVFNTSLRDEKFQSHGQVLWAMKKINLNIAPLKSRMRCEWGVNNLGFHVSTFIILAKAESWLF